MFGGWQIDTDVRGGVSGPTLYEREDELALIDAVLGSGLRGSGQFLLLEGSPGLGKSVLIQESLRRSSRLGMRVLSVTASDRERAVPHAISHRLFSPMLEVLSEEEQEAVFNGAAVLARPVFDEDPAVGDMNSPDYGLARLHGLFWLLSNLAESGGPILVAVDDAQWADGASMRFLAYLLPRLEALPVSVVVAGRPDAVHLVGAPFQHVRSHPLAHVTRLSPLSKQVCKKVFGDVLSDEPDPDLCERYWQITQGNPFLMEQVMVAHREGRGAEVDLLMKEMRGRDRGLELAVARQRLNGASEEEQAFARAAASLGPAANLNRCAQLADLTTSVAQSALDDLIEKGVLRNTHPIEFIHPLVADAMLQGVRAGDLEVLHRRAAEMLHEEGSSAELVASFLLLCDPVNEQWAIDALKEAARRSSAIGASDSASVYIRRLLKEELTDVDRGRALMELGRAEALLNTERAVGHLRESLRYFEDLNQRIEVYGMIGHQLVSLARYRDALEVLDEALNEAGEADERTAYRLRVNRVSIARLLPDKRDTALLELDALAIDAPPPGDPIARQAYTEMALVHVRRGISCDDAVEALHHAIPDLHAPLGPVAIDWLLPVQLHCAAWTDQLEMGADLRMAALAEARRRGSLMLFATVGAFGGLGAYQEGSVSECAALAQQAIDAIPDGWAVGIPFACTIAAYAYMERGELNEAERVLNIAFSDERTEESLQLGHLLEARGRLALMWGTPDAAIDDLERAGRFMTDVVATSNPAVLGWRTRLARAFLSKEDKTRALDLAEEEIHLARKYGAARPIASALRVKGDILGKDGIEALEEAWSLIETSPARLEKASTQVSLGRSLRLAGDLKRARVVLNEGLRGAVSCGSVMLENFARSELATAGARPRRKAVTGIAALTPGERRVVELAAQGKSNREIAEFLFVTVKAVEWHLSNAYRKLEISSRDALRDLDLSPSVD